MANLIDAVRLGDTGVVRALFERDPQSLHRGDAQGMTPLMWAAWHGAVELVRWLLAHGAQAAVRDIRGATALVLAAERGHLETVRELVARADQDERGEALRQAVGAGRHEVTAWLLDEAGAPLEYGGAEGKTPLTCAVLGGHSALADELLRRGANVAAPSSHFLALENLQDSGWQPLHYAADRRHALLVQQLLDAGATVDAATVLGTTPLMLAVLRGDEDTVRLLLRAGAEPLRENLGRASALSLSRQQGKPHITRLLERRAEEAPLTRVQHRVNGLGERAS
ncbi:ankyrin repeat domain-containing protein [Cystobacter ferrugineus]|uniref:Uncharacterized protein n=1 Tax=Cystobacter ferrugineus TaxID=83449 RepID=A0A1L9B2K0_9BACT|nr:ankyrin repeat domain-containing protein [Cystobacter ferrugineus]OJH36446.1 hypothetical protein BON30_32275 [Cystobacter ferrugineus]